MPYRPPRGRTPPGKPITADSLPAEHRARQRRRGASSPIEAAQLTFAAGRKFAAAAHNALPAEDRKRALRAAGQSPGAVVGAAKATAPSTVRAGGTVLEVRRVRPDLLRLFLAKPAGFVYSPGQSVRLELGGTRRRYTLASAPHEPHLEFFIEIVPQGRMTSKIARLSPGDCVGIAGAAKGGVTLDEDSRNHLMLATVTGVNPFVSILRDAVYRGRRDLNCVLVHGASHSDEFGYDAEAAKLARRRPDLLTYIPTVSRPQALRNSGWKGAKGRVEALIPALRQRFELSPAVTTAYACGHPGMVENARRILSGMGYKVRTEKYD